MRMNRIEGRYAACSVLAVVALCLLQCGVPETPGSDGSGTAGSGGDAGHAGDAGSSGAGGTGGLGGGGLGGGGFGGGGGSTNPRDGGPDASDPNAFLCVYGLYCIRDVEYCAHASGQVLRLECRRYPAGCTTCGCAKEDIGANAEIKRYCSDHYECRQPVEGGSTVLGDSMGAPDLWVGCMVP